MSPGLNRVPQQIYALDCIYLDTGRANRFTTERFRRRVAAETPTKLADASGEREVEFDRLKPAESREPTLNPEMGYINKKIKKLSLQKVVVPPGGSLLDSPAVRQYLPEADIVIGGEFKVEFRSEILMREGAGYRKDNPKAADCTGDESTTFSYVNTTARKTDIIGLYVEMLAMLARRPCTCQYVSAAPGISRDFTISEPADPKAGGVICGEQRRGRTFFRLLTQTNSR